MEQMLVPFFYWNAEEQEQNFFASASIVSISCRGRQFLTHSGNLGDLPAVSQSTIKQKSP